ncbi:hypothetical protein M3Y98_00789500 [Aphelenchoides besseyi]|nr:hypothetical protein M3Y98_00789500 [Aphelenchoides besseyi]
MTNKTSIEDFFPNWNPCKNSTRPFDNCLLKVEYYDFLGINLAVALFAISLVMYLTFYLLSCSACSGCVHYNDRESNRKKSKRSVKSQRPTHRTVIAARPSSVRMDSTEETSDIPSVRVSARTNGSLAQSRR